MSRVGKAPIPVPDGVNVDLSGTHLVVKGGKGQLELDVHPEMKVVLEDGLVLVQRPTDQTRHRALHGLTRSLIANMVTGVSAGFSKELQLVGVGYRAQMQGADLTLNLGFSHPIKFTPAAGVNIETPEPTRIVVSSHDKELVGRTASQIRKYRPPEPYKGKGILYKGEHIKRKAGKSGKAVA